MIFEVPETKEKVFMSLCSCGEPIFIQVIAWNVLRDDPEMVDAVGTPFELIISRGIGLPVWSLWDKLRTIWTILRGKYRLLDSIHLNEKEALELRDYITMTHDGGN